MGSSGTVFLVDDDPAVRHSLEALLGSVGLPLVAYAGAEEFLDAELPDEPCCLVLDLRMPGMGGAALQREMIERGEEIPIIFVTGYGEVTTAVDAMKNGAFDFVEKPYNHQRLLDRIRAALEADAEARAHRADADEVRARLSDLTKREREVLALVTQGHSTKEIAARLHRSSKTVDAHRSSILKKMKARSLGDLMRMVVLVEAGHNAASA